MTTFRMLIKQISWEFGVESRDKSRVLKSSGRVREQFTNVPTTRWDVKLATS